MRARAASSKARADFRAADRSASIETVKAGELIWTDRDYTFAGKHHTLDFSPPRRLVGMRFVRSGTYVMGRVICTRSGLAYALTSQSGSSSQAKYLVENGFHADTTLDTSLFAVFKRDFKLGESFSIPGKWGFLVF